MSEVLTAAQMRAIEQVEIASGRVSGCDLMERAGAAVVGALTEFWPELGVGAHHAAVLCGPGNNGGDGFVVARLLAARGWRVECHALTPDMKMPLDAAENRRRWEEIGPVLPLDGLQGVKGRPVPGVIIDALFGTGLTRPLAGIALQALAAVADGIAGTAIPPRVIAVDIPSGLSADTGRDLGCRLRADLTVTFHRAKLGHYLDNGPACCGHLVVAGIGLNAEAGPDAQPVDIVRGARVDVRNLRKRTGHKYGYGHALILAGGPGEGGAARLSARGALRIGAGLVTVACPMSALSENAARLDTVMLRPLHDGAALERLLEDKRYNALCLGPGMGHVRAEALVPVALAAGRPAVLDADALSAFAGDPRRLFALLHDRCILTPHGGEFARLFPDLAARQSDPAGDLSKVGATRMAAARAGATILFKGPDTVIATPAGNTALHSAAYGRAAPWLATAGSGDVLAGFIAGLLARGLDPFTAASTAAWLHVECALQFGPGLIADDLSEALPGVFRALGV